jgi:hypothetical protein
MRLHISCRFAPYAETPRLRVRNGIQVAEVDSIWTESFGPNCWLAGGQNAEIQFGHDAAKIGEVIAVAAHGKWYELDAVVETNDPEVLDRLKVGTPVSLGARTLDRDDDHDIHTRHHKLAQLQHIAIARPGERAKYPGAQITAVREAKPKPRLTDEQARVELYRRYHAGEDFADVAADLDGNSRPHNWHLPYIEKAA